MVILSAPSPPLLLVLLVVSSCLLQGLAGGEGGEGVDVVSLGHWDFEAKVFKSSKLPWLVQFFAPWCSHCQQLGPVYDHVGANLRDIMNVGKVDCTVEERLCSRLDVDGFPQIYVYVNEETSFKYTGPRDAPSIIKFATNKIRAIVFDISSPQNEGEGQREGDKQATKGAADKMKTFLSYNKELPHLLLFSTRKAPSALLKSLARLHDDRLVVALVSANERDLAEFYGITSYPSLITVDSTLEEETSTPPLLETFEEATTKQGLIDSFRLIADSLSPEILQAIEQRRKRSDLLVGWEAADVENLPSLCPMWCLLVFPSQTADPELNEFFAFLEEYPADLALNHAYVDNSPVLRQRMGVTADSPPTYAIYHAKKLKYVRAPSFEGGKAVKSFIDDVMHGNMKFILCDQVEEQGEGDEIQSEL